MSLASRLPAFMRLFVLLERVLIPTLTPTPGHGRRGGTSVARKNANGEGSRLRERADGRWEAHYWVDGKRSSVYGNTRKEAADKSAKALANIDEPSTQFELTNKTVREFFEQYDYVARDTVKRRSYETYRDIARLHLLPAFGTMKIRPLSLEEAKRFLALAEGDRFAALFVLGVTSGARWGELTGLYWSDLQLHRRVMHIQRALITGHGKQTFESPKTKASRRSVALTRKATDALIRYRERQAAAGFPMVGDTLVFTNTIGGPLNPSHFTQRHFKPLLKRADLPDTTWHAATRHTCTCILLLEGDNPKSVAMQMGWSSVAFMLENYARFLPGWGDNGAMDAALS